MMNNMVVAQRPVVYILLAISMFLIPMKWIFSWIVAVLVHELGHYVMIRVLGYQVWKIQISARGVDMQTAPMDGLSEAVCAVAGPIASFLLISVARWLPYVALCGFFHGFYNLIPIYPLDGGRVLKYALLNLTPIKRVPKLYYWTNRLMIISLCVASVVLSVKFSYGMIPIIAAGMLLFQNMKTKIPCKL